MAKKAEQTPDIFMQFKVLEIDLDATDSTTLVEAEVHTGLSIRGQLLWLIHLVEFFIPMVATVAFNGVSAVVSTIQELAVLPDLGDRGTVAWARKEYDLAGATLGAISDSPQRLAYFPPIPLAAPMLSLYAEGLVDIASMRGRPVIARLGFTTTHLDAASYQELAEVWGW